MWKRLPGVTYRDGLDCKGRQRRLPWARFYFENTKKVEFLTTAFAPVPLHDLQKPVHDAAASCSRMPRRNKQCLRRNVQIVIAVFKQTCFNKVQKKKAVNANTRPSNSQEAPVHVERPAHWKLQE